MALCLCIASQLSAQTVSVEGGTIGATSFNAGAGVTPALEVSGNDANATNGYGFFVAGNATPSLNNQSPHTQISTGNADSRLTLKCGDPTDFAPRLQMLSGNDQGGTNNGAATFDYGSRNFNTTGTAFFSMRFMPTAGAPVEMFRASADASVAIGHQGGNVGIGTSSPAAKFHVMGDIRFEFGSPADGDVLSYDATSGNLEWSAMSGGGGGASALNDLSDVNASPAMGDVLSWDGSMWVASTLSGGGGSDTDWVQGSGTLTSEAGAYVGIGDENVGLGSLEIDGGASSDVPALTALYTLNDEGFSMIGEMFADSTAMDSSARVGVYGTTTVVPAGSAIIGSGVEGDAQGGQQALGVFGYAAFGDSLNAGVFGVGDSIGGPSAGVYGRCLDVVLDWGGFFAGDIGTTGSLFELSDARLKTNVEEVKNGLALVKELRPVTYNYQSNPHIDMNENRMQYGFIAQEVEDIMPGSTKAFQTPSTEFTRDEEGHLRPVARESAEYKALNYTQLIPVLTQAIQEQQEIIDAQAQELSEIKQLLVDAGLVEKNTADNVSVEGTMLYQNRPNPFNNTTEIPYFLKENTSAQIVVFEMATGAAVKTFEVSGQGHGKVTMEAGTLPSGSYTYSLMIDGKSVSSKIMLITK